MESKKLASNQQMKMKEKNEWVKKMAEVMMEKSCGRCVGVGTGKG